MGWRGTALLAVALAIAVAYTWYDTASDPHGLGQGTFLGEERGPPPGENIKRLLDFTPADVNAIHLQRGTFEARLTRTENGWSGVARPQLIDDFVRNIAELAEIAPIDVQREDRRDYGLDPPAGVIELERTGKPPLQLLTGSHNPASTGAYVQLGSDGPVLLTGALMLWEFDKAIRALQESAAAADAAPAANAPPAAAPVAAGPAAVTAHTGRWESGYGETFFNIVGTVKNTGKEPLAWIRLHADLLDKDQHVVAGMDFYNYRAEGLSREDLPADMKQKVEIVDPSPVPAGGDDRFRTSFLKDETPPFDSYRVSIVQVGQE